MSEPLVFKELVAALADFQQVLAWDATDDAPFFSGTSVILVDFRFILLLAAGTGIAVNLCGILLNLGFFAFVVHIVSEKPSPVEYHVY